jgi:hypothetical protein
MHPGVQTNVYAELAKCEAIKPVDHAYNIVRWHLAMESKCIGIEQKVPGSYHESQYIMDYLDASLTVDAKSFKAEANINCNRYLCGNPDRWNAIHISGEIIKTYNNMSKDGTWKQEIGEKDQIIALSTKVVEQQAKLKNQVKQVVVLAMQAKKKITPDSNNGGEGGGPRHLKRDPYTVAACQLTKKEDKVQMHSKDYCWCTGNHWSGRTKHNGMCAPITNLVITTLRGLVWTNVAKMAMGIMVNQMRLPLNLQKLLLRSLPSMTNFATHVALRLVYPLKQLIESGRMPRETSRSKSRVE